MTGGPWTRQFTSDFYVGIGADLRRIRNLKGLSLADVEKLARGGVSRQTLRHYETAERRVSIEGLYYLAELYQVPVTAFLPESDGALMVPLDSVIAHLEKLREVPE